VDKKRGDGRGGGVRRRQGRGTGRTRDGPIAEEDRGMDTGGGRVDRRRGAECCADGVEEGRYGYGGVVLIEQHAGAPVFT